jgi:periplasmic copper chaperone A
MRTVNVAPIALVIALAAFAATAAEEIKLSELVIYDAWARASAGPALNGVAYVSIHNHGPADRLVGASTPVAARSELHAHVVEAGVMKMRPSGPIDIAPAARVRLEPGGQHVMLIGLSASLKEGSTFPLTLRFEKAGEITLMASVLKAGDMGPGDPHQRHQGEHERRQHHEHLGQQPQQRR